MAWFFCYQASFALNFGEMSSATFEGLKSSVESYLVLDVMVLDVKTVLNGKPMSRLLLLYIHTSFLAKEG